MCPLDGCSFPQSLEDDRCRHCEAHHYYCEFRHISAMWSGRPARRRNEALSYPLQHQTIEPRREGGRIFRQFAVKDLRLFEQQ
jgi:hypothetical protein